MESYKQNRSEKIEADGIDRFFLRAGNFSRAQAHSVILARHKRLIATARQRSLEESQIVSYMLTYLETSVFRPDPKG